MYSELISRISHEKIIHAAKRSIIVLICLFGGMLSGPLYTLIQYDYGLPLGIAFWLGPFMYLPLATVVYFLTLRMRKLLTKEKEYPFSAHAFLSFFSMSLYYPLYSAFNGLDVFDDSRSIFIVMFLVPTVVFIMSLVIVHCVQYAFMVVNKVRAVQLSVATTVAAILILSLRSQTIPPSANDVCKHIQSGWTKQQIAPLLAGYEVRSSRQFSPAEDYYTFYEDDSGYFLLSLGLYCEIDMTDGKVTGVRITSDSF